MIKVEIIKDSISDKGHRLTTMALTYPRFIHAEFMTHRVFSRNASSSRAIPVVTVLRNILRDPATPVAWGRNKPGMQAGEDLTGLRLALTKFAWHTACYAAVACAWVAAKAGAHKQIANRITEPWSHITVLVTSTDWNNFFALRNHKDADPTIHQLAKEMFEAYEQSIPEMLEQNDWHLPFISYQEYHSHDLRQLLKMSAARCARVSYLRHDGKTPTVEDDLRLYDQLVTAELVHASPTEHQATPDTQSKNGRWAHQSQHGNLHGWIQHRKLIPNEKIQ